MKYFENLTDTEILALTEQEIEHYTQLRAAQEGLAIVPKPALPEPKEPSIKKTVTVYEAGGILFLDILDAEAFLELKPYKQDYSHGGYNYLFLKEIEDEITTKRMYCEEQVNNLKVELQKYKEKKDAYNSEQNKYAIFTRKLRELNKSIYDKVKELKDQECRKLELKKQYGIYLELANQDEEIAKNFFVKAYSEEEYNDLSN